MRYENFENNLELFVRGYNKLTTDGNEFHVTPEEFYIYCLLVTKQNRDESMIANVDVILHHMLIDFSPREQTNKIKVREALQGLIEKRVLICVDGTKAEDIKNHTVMTLLVNDKELSSNPNEYAGFQKVYYNDFIQFLTADELFVHHVISRFGKFDCSESRWARILSAGKDKPITDDTARRRLKEVAERNKLNKDKDKSYIGVIEIITGRYIEVTKQEVNSYIAIQWTQNRIDKIKKENKKKIDESKKLKAVSGNPF